MRNRSYSWRLFNFIRQLILFPFNFKFENVLHTHLISYILSVCGMHDPNWE
ncbi:hypothetical protein WN943_020802 [Citrus x changshan-huyou]